MKNFFDNKIFKFNKVCLAFMLILSMSVLTSCTSLKQAVTDFLNEDPPEERVVSSEEPESGEREDISEEAAAELAMKYISGLSLEEKVGQLFSVNLELLDNTKGSYYEHQKITKAMKESLSKYHVGGVILFQRNINNRKQTSKLIRKLQKNSEIPLFIMVDEEGGAVARVGQNPDMGTTAFESAEVIGRTEDPEYTKSMGSIIGSEISELGFNVDLAPVADVNISELNTEIGNRSFGSDAELVSEFVANFVEGIQSQNVSACLKHFPGQGSSEGDTHNTNVDIDADIATLRENDFVPFEKGIEAGADFMMVSHISVSKVTETETPASLSKLIMTTIMREELGFGGIIITDAFDMTSITELYSAGDAAITAIQAGADIVLMPEDLDEAYNAVLSAVNSGDIDEARVDESVIRILTRKFQRGIIATEPVE
ncbi:MAG: glycoside hydrolase family 3 protein [Lachnospiraceae bacterium]|nr:glycoside hydrolase family 3 protein [Lachnospiraceae bacterium]